MSSLRVVPRADVAPGAWDEAADSSADAWLWHRHSFPEVLATWPSRIDRSFAVVGGDGCVAALVPAHLVTRRVAGLPVDRIELFGGPVVTGGDAEAWERARAHLRAMAKHTRAVHVTAVVSAVTPSVLAGGDGGLTELGFQDHSGAAWVVDLRGAERVMWGRVQARTREYIRSAARRGVVVRSGSESDLDQYYALHRETCERTGAVAHPRSYFGAIWRTFAPAGRARLLVAEIEGTAVAACIVGSDKRAAVYWSGVSSAEGQRAHANEVLLWEAIRSSAAEHDAFDLGDSHRAEGTAKHRAIAAFKRKFGGDERRLPRGRLPVRPRPVELGIRIAEVAAGSITRRG